jgi:hypothetical protein
VPVHLEIFLREKPRDCVGGIEAIAKIGDVVDPDFPVCVGLETDGRALEYLVVGVLVQRSLDEPSVGVSAKRS